MFGIAKLFAARPLRPAKDWAKAPPAPGRPTAGRQSPQHRHPPPPRPCTHSGPRAQAPRVGKG
eukprot:9907284-Alexandrium_andersonii.AAC.1